MSTAATGVLGPVWLVNYTAVLVLSATIDTGRLNRRLPRWALDATALACFAIYPLDYLLLTRTFVGATIHFTLALAAVKLLTRASDRDWAYLYVVSFVEILAASTLTVDLAFALTLLVFLIAGANTLVLLEMRRSHARLGAAGDLGDRFAARVEAASPGPVTRCPVGSLAWTSAATTGMILVLAVPIFLLTPRITLGIYNRPSPRPQLLSGFSERVELGALGTIKESDEVVMRVRLARIELGRRGGAHAMDDMLQPAGDEHPWLGPPPKWRGIALDVYDGRAWSRSRSAQARRIASRGEYFKLQPEVRPDATLLKQTFFLEGLSTRVLFACARPIAVAGGLGTLLQTDSGDLSGGVRPPAKLQYAVLSDVTPEDRARLWGSEFPPPPEIRARYLQRPTLDPRIAALARQLTRSQAHPFEKARAIEQHLRSRYGYSLELTSGAGGGDPLAAFLFDVRRGHCEYFASALAIMLREIDIPSRIVNGFRTGEYNRLGRAWVVRQYDAHSWVEAYFPPAGWVEFDPTPPDPARPRSAWRKALLDLADALDLWWSDDVVNYTFWNQQRLLASTRARAARLQEAFRRVSVEIWRRSREGFDGSSLEAAARRGARHAGAVAIALAAIVGLAVLSRARPGWLARSRRRLRRALHGNDPGVAVSTFYADALALLERQGMRRALAQTPREFAHAFGSRAFGPPFLALTELYNRIRFGARPEDDDTARAARLLQSLRSTLAADPGPGAPPVVPPGGGPPACRSVDS